MEMGGKFCVMCGKEDVKLIGRLCPSCYVKSREMVRVPRSMSITVCRICGSRKLKGKWVAPRGDISSSLEEEIISALELDEHVQEYHVDVGQMWSDTHGNNHFPLRISGSVEGERFDETKDVMVKVESTLCDSCVKRRGKYYEAIIQLRSREGNLGLDEKRFFESFFSREDAENLSDVVELREGVDYYFINRTVAKRLVAKFASEVKVEMKESYQRERIKRGKRDAKLVISLRL
ncbi:nonsense-mediated mRNA decay protein 3 [Metallosphaera sedula]|nr:nonsense-mediated mRNA decay protein 3 [Metallosphaera sedula]